MIDKAKPYSLLRLPLVIVVGPRAEAIFPTASFVVLAG